MTPPIEISVPVGHIGRAVRAQGTVALVGNPNAGKSTLFNRLTGLSQRTANYPGVTVERHTGRAAIGDHVIDLVDLPGIYSLTPNSLDERVAVEVLLGQIADTPQPDAILAVVDATRLYQGLYLVQQLLELGRPVAVALTMTDAAKKAGLKLDLAQLERRLGGARVFPVVASTGRGLEALRTALVDLPVASPPQRSGAWPELQTAVDELRPVLKQSGLTLHYAEIERLIIDDQPEDEHTPELSPDMIRQIADVRQRLCGSEPPLAVEARRRYAWIRDVLDEVQGRHSALARRSEKLVQWLNQPWPATVMFLVMMALVFQAVFAWATPVMDLIDLMTTSAGKWLETAMGPGMLTSFLVDGVIAGVGSVIIFLPQILILFLFIILMEDTGYLARAAFLVDRAMRAVGLSGQSVIPLLSSFACAVPSIMATRVIPNRRDRIATILAAPFMTCSARLPIYALLIAAFVPDRQFLIFNLQGLVLLGLYGLGIVGGVVTALLLRRSALRGVNPSFVLALPEFRLPNVPTVLIKLLDRIRVFLRRAGTVIFAVAVIVWALAFFPRSAGIEAQAEQQRGAAEQAYADAVLDARLDEIDNQAAADHLAQSYLGRAGQWIEPVFKPLGWDWRVSAAVIAGFPAREVVVAVLGTIYAVGGEASDESLARRLETATWPDGRPVFTVPMVIGLLVFYAWCLQCVATLAVIRRETNTWRWPVFAWFYMTTLGYLGALLIYQVGSLS
ncbi:MAG: ferrous iron transport protein B [Gammaproteobacteria bacterium]|nr:ferrous iron transport protein B [Gammaproteobacteria bacterium]